jgi:glycosyltransferase involved in cell wall biosynthesis
MLRRPWRVAILAAKLVWRWAGLTRGALREKRSNPPDFVLVGYLGHFDVFLARLLFSKPRTVLDHLLFAGDTAADRGEGGWRVRLLRALDGAATAQAGIVIVDTDEHLAMLKGAARRRGVVVPVGATGAWFAAAVQPSDLAVHALRVVFYGLFTPLQGAPMIAEGLARAAHLAEQSGARIEVTMVGTGQDLDAARRGLAGVPQVRWIDWVEPADLPRLVAAHDVCLGIMSTTPKGRRVVPNKVYQGLAAGCVVVTANTPAQARTLGKHLRMVEAGNAEALGRELAKLTDQAQLSKAREQAAGGRELVRPQRIVAPLLQAMGIKSEDRGGER